MRSLSMFAASTAVVIYGVESWYSLRDIYFYLLYKIIEDISLPVSTIYPGRRVFKEDIDVIALHPMLLKISAKGTHSRPCTTTLRLSVSQEHKGKPKTHIHFVF